MRSTAHPDSLRRGPTGKSFAGCRVESLFTVDDRGQMVLPKDLRDKAGIKGATSLP